MGKMLTCEFGYLKKIEPIADWQKPLLDEAGIIALYTDEEGRHFARFYTWEGWDGVKVETGCGEFTKKDGLLVFKSDDAVYTFELDINCLTIRQRNKMQYKLMDRFHSRS